MGQINTNNHFETPCFILDVIELKRSIEGYQNALKRRFSNCIVGYSVKTNSLPYSIKKAGEFGAFAEVVSADEYKLALLCGIHKDHIIYNGPMKSKETFIDAINNGAYVNVETKRELEWLKELPIDRDFKIGIRLNINISKLSPEDADGENDNSRFGFSDDTNEFENAVAYINDLQNVSLKGLHIHRTAHSRSVRFYQNSLKYACETVRKYNLTLDYIDIGGGYFGIFPSKPTYQDYSDAFYNTLKEYSLESLCVIVEPGNALVASCYSFLSSVIDIKNVEGEYWFITTDGSRNDIDPFFKKCNYLEEELYSSDSPIVQRQIITGCTCLEYDRMFELKNKPMLKVGDQILYHNVGAYTMCLSPLFIRLWPTVYAIENGKSQIVRERWSAEEIMKKSKL